MTGENNNHCAQSENVSCLKLCIPAPSGFYCNHQVAAQHPITLTARPPLASLIFLGKSSSLIVSEQVMGPLINLLNLFILYKYAYVASRIMYMYVDVHICMQSVGVYLHTVLTTS